LKLEEIDRLVDVLADAAMRFDIQIEDGPDDCQDLVEDLDYQDVRDALLGSYEKNHLDDDLDDDSSDSPDDDSEIDCDEETEEDLSELDYEDLQSFVDLSLK